jgi:Fur family peroxide stress response transcriptional regulator
MRTTHRTATPRPSAEVDAWCARFEERCRARGVRVTAQRLAVYRAVAGDLGHPTAVAVHQALLRTSPSLPLASVYRILESLEREGMLRRVGSLGGGGRYDANVGPHQHLVCRRCGAMSDFLDPSFADLSLPSRETPGFKPESLDVRILGTCEACAQRRVTSQRASTHRSATRRAD